MRACSSWGAAPPSALARHPAFGRQPPGAPASRAALVLPAAAQPIRAGPHAGAARGAARSLRDLPKPGRPAPAHSLRPSAVCPRRAAARGCGADWRLATCTQQPLSQGFRRAGPALARSSSAGHLAVEVRHGALAVLLVVPVRLLASQQPHLGQLRDLLRRSVLPKVCAMEPQPGPRLRMKSASHHTARPR